jgi:gamma-glutamyltranspeptidase/glutathione hydrolase
VQKSCSVGVLYQEEGEMKTMHKARALFLALTLSAACSAVLAWAASQPAVEAKHGMVVSSQRYASEVGTRILQEGGNAIDAAVAVGYALSVVHPCCGNIGGGGFMAIHLADGRNTFINFRETAPAAATERMYLDARGNPIKDLNLYGYLAVGVPGTVMGLDRALLEYGTMPRAKVMAPAVKLARDGFILNRGDTDILDTKVDRLRMDPGASKIFLRPDGTPLEPGDRLVQKDLASTLELIAKQGPDAFYKGPIAKAVEQASKTNGGILTSQDFANYTVTEGPPVTCSYRGYILISSPPPSSGGTAMCETLNILEGYDMKAMGFRSAQSVHFMVEAMRHAYLDRNTYLGDPAFVKNPLDRLLSKEYAAAIRAKIDPEKMTLSKEVRPGVEPHESTETTHYSVVDSEGNAVSATYTVNSNFGASVGEVAAAETATGFPHGRQAARSQQLFESGDCVLNSLLFAHQSPENFHHQASIKPDHASETDVDRRLPRADRPMFDRRAGAPPAMTLP